MENFIISLEVVCPMFLMMLVGFIIKKIKIVDDSTLKQTNNMVFRIFLPLLVFRNIYTSDLSVSFSPKLLLFALAAILALFFLAFVVIVCIEKDNRRKGVLIQAIFRSNFVLFGIPVITSLYGEESAGVASIIIAVAIPLYNVLAVVSLEIFRGGRIDVKKILKGIVTNPLIIGSALGILILLSGFEMPAMIDGTVDSLSKIATPLAFVILGGTFDFSTLKSDIRQLLIGVLGRLVASPMIGLPISILLGFRGAELVVLMVMFGAPPAVSSFTMAQQMDADSDLAGSIVIIASIASIFTVFLWTFLLKQTCYI